MNNLCDCLNVYINDCFDKALCELKISHSSFSPLTIYSYTPIVDGYACSNLSISSYLKLKAKESILKEMLIELALLLNDAENSFCTLSDAYKLYGDLLQGNFHEACDTCIHSSIQLELSPTAFDCWESKFQYTQERHKSVVLSSNKNKFADRKRKFNDIMNTSHSSELWPFDTQKGILSSFNFEKLTDYIPNYHQTFSPENFFKRNLLLLYLELFQSPAVQKDSFIIPNDFSLYVSFIFSEILTNSNLFTSCEKVMYGFEDKQRPSQTSLSYAKRILSRDYARYTDKSIRLVHNLAYMHGEEQLCTLCTDILLQKLLHYPFFNALDCDLFQMIASKIYFTDYTHGYRLNESVFYFSILRTFMKFDINLDDLSSFGFADTVGSYPFYIQSLEYFENALSKVAQGMGPFISSYFTQTALHDDSVSKVLPLLLKECKEELVSISGRWSFLKLNNKIETKNIYDSSTKNVENILSSSVINFAELPDREAAVLSSLLHSLCYDNIINSDLL